VVTVAAAAVTAVEWSENVAEASLLKDFVGDTTGGGDERSTPDADVLTGVKLITKPFFLSFLYLSLFLSVFV
jgi:hypothetical protein